MKLRSATAAPKPEPADEEMPLAPPPTDPDPETANSSDDYVPPGTASSAKKRKAKKVDDKERSPKTPKAPKKGKRKGKEVERKDGPFPLLELPGELIDQILADDDLHLGSHLALAATCKLLRTCYYSRRPRSANLSGFHSPVWGALLSARPFTGEGSSSWRKEDVDVEIPDEPERIVKHLWTREDRVEVAKMVVVQGKAAVRAHEWDVVMHKVANQRITKTTAKSAYKLNDAELNALTPQYKRNPHGRSAAPMQLFVEAAVEALAFRLHGGAAGHAALLKKRAATKAKASATRRAKAYGTWVSPGKKRWTAVDTDDSSSSDEEGEDDAAQSLSPSLSPILTTQRGRASGAGAGTGTGASPSKSVAAALAQLSTTSPAKVRSSSAPLVAPLALGPAFALQPAAAQGSLGLAPVKGEEATSGGRSAFAQLQAIPHNPSVGGEVVGETPSPTSTSFLLPNTPIPYCQTLLGPPSQSAAAVVPPLRAHQPEPAAHPSSLAPTAAPATASPSTSAPPPLSVSAIPNLTDDERRIVLHLLRGDGDGPALAAGASSSSTTAAAAAAAGPAPGHGLEAGLGGGGGGEAQQEDGQNEPERKLEEGTPFGSAAA
ncbi:hypothetical protein JCM8208_001481 [Rhodotorula glutinis]